MAPGGLCGKAQRSFNVFLNHLKSTCKFQVLIQKCHGFILHSASLFPDPGSNSDNSSSFFLGVLVSLVHLICPQHVKFQ